MSGDQLPVRGFGVGVDLRGDGLLWFINKNLLHPMGYMLAFNESVSAAEATPEKPQFILSYEGEPIEFVDNLTRDGRPLPDILEAALKRARTHLFEMTGEGSTSPG